MVKVLGLGGEVLALESGEERMTKGKGIDESGIYIYKGNPSAT